MPNDQIVPATIPATLPKAQSRGLIARGLSALQQSLPIGDKDSAERLFERGKRFRNGENETPQDDEKARVYFLAAAKLDHAEAQFELCLLLGEYDEWPEGVVWLEKSVSQGFGPAQAYVAEWLSEPLIADHLTKSYEVAQLYDQASAWYQRRANDGDAEVQYQFSLMLKNSDAPIYSPEEAMRWMKAAAEQDHGSACWRLGGWLLNDRDPLFNAQQGIYWLSRAAELGKSPACKRLGDLYLFGHMGGRLNRGPSLQIVPPDKRLAVSWYERQIDLERERGSYLGTHSLAREYLFGDHLEQNVPLAERMLLDAANAGNLESQRLLASEYASGKRLKRDVTAALDWLMLAEQNSDSSKREDRYNLGRFYEYHADDSPNYAQAAKWYRKAADEGDYRSQKSLGDMYEAGKGLSKDPVQALMWYLLSAANSYGKPGIRDFHTSALRLRDLLAERMPASQRAEAAKLASKWMDGVRSLRATDLELAREGLASAS